MYNYVNNLNKVCKFYERRNIYKIKGVLGRALWSIGFSSNDLKLFYQKINDKKNNNFCFSFLSQEEVLIANAFLFILKIKNKKKFKIKLRFNVRNFIKKNILIYKLYILFLNLKYNFNLKKKNKTNILFFWDKYKYINLYNLLKPQLGRNLNLIPFMNKFSIENYIDDCVPQTYNLDFFNTKKFSNKFDVIYEILKNTLIKLKPKKVIFVEGDSPFQSLLVNACKDLKIESICLQWGSSVWKKPRYGFRDLYCDKFLAHGEFFVNEVKKYNKNTKFYNVGNPLLNKADLNKKKSAIFLLQPSHTDPKKNLFKLMENIIKKNKDWFFFIRPHPNQDNLYLLKKYSKFKNIKIVYPHIENLHKSLKKNSISISSYSSSIVDSFNYNIVPLVYNTSLLLKKYNPNLKKHKLGIETKNFIYAKKKFNEILNNQTELLYFKKNIYKKKKFFIKNHGKKSIKELTKAILK